MNITFSKFHFHIHFFFLCKWLLPQISLHSKTVPSVSNPNFNFNIIIKKSKMKLKYLKKFNSYSFWRFHLSKHLTVPQFTLPEWVSNVTSLYKVLGHEVYYCAKHETKGEGATQKMKSSAVFLSSISITYLSSPEGTFFQQIVGIPMVTNCAPLLVETSTRQNLYKNLSRTK